MIVGKGGATLRGTVQQLVRVLDVATNPNAGIRLGLLASQSSHRAMASRTFVTQSVTLAARSGDWPLPVAMTRLIATGFLQFRPICSARAHPGNWPS